MRIVTGLVVAAFCLFAATGANAQQIYIGAQGGPNFAFDSEVEQFGATADLSYLPGGALSLYAGYAFPFGLRLEGELAIRGNEVDDLEGLELDGTVGSVALMVNVFYDFNTGTGFVPYVGAGFGGATVIADEIEFAGFLLLDDSAGAFAYQFGGGLAYKFNQTVALTGDLRFFGTTDVEMTDEFGDDLTVTYFTTSFMFGVRFSF